MMVRIKDGVEFAVIAPAGYLILQAIKEVSAEEDIDLTITSGTDGDHSGPTDPHKTGEAYDIRSKDLDRGMKSHVLVRLSEELGDGFFCFLESPGGASEHIHCQREKGTTFTIQDFFARS